MYTPTLHNVHTEGIYIDIYAIYMLKVYVGKAISMRTKFSFETSIGHIYALFMLVLITLTSKSPLRHK